VKLFLDSATCAGTGICGAIASDIIEFGDDGRPIILSVDVSSDAITAVESAVECCPTGALRLVDC
jgi:ferredoxin